MAEWLDSQSQANKISAPCVPWQAPYLPPNPVKHHETSENENGSAGVLHWCAMGIESKTNCLEQVTVHLSS